MKKNMCDLSVTEEFGQIIKNERRKNKINKMSSLGVLAVLIVFFGIFADGFFAYSNFIAVLYQLAIPLILAIGATFVIIIGSIDLSIEGLMALTGTLTAYFVLNNTNGNNFGLFSILFAMMIGFGFGITTGFIQVKTKIPSFLLTFAVSSIATGITLFIYKGIMIGIKDQLFISIASTSILGIPLVMWIALVLFIVAYIIQEYTSFGRYIYAIGSNESIPRSTGVNVQKIKILVFGFSGLCIGLAGALGASRIAFGDLSIGTGNLFPTLTAVVLGGTSLAGGKGGVVNTLVGAVIVAILNNGLILIGVSPTIIAGIQGLIILIAVTLSMERKKGQINK